MGWRTLAVVALVLVGVGAVGIALFGPALASSNDTQYITATASRTNVVEQAVADGNLAAAQEYGLAFGSKAHVIDPGSSSSSASSGSGSTTWLVSQVSATVGQQVKAGDVLAIGDTSSAQTALAVAQANLATAQAKYDADSGGPTATDKQSAQLSVDQAQQQLTAAKQSRDDTIKQNAIKLSQAKDAVTQAKQKLADDKAAAAPDTVITADQQNVTQAKQSLSLSEIQINASNRQARQQVSSAEIALQNAQNSYDNNTAPAASDVIASDHAAVLQAQQAVDNAQAQLDAATLTAPIDGTIIAVNIAAGVDAPSGDAIQLIGKDMQVTADFSEADIPSLAVGQDASVTVTATNDVLAGKVTSIDPLAATSGGSSVVSYAVTVDLGAVPAQVMSGMSAQVAVTLAESDNVIAVPAIALVGSNGTYSVRVMDSTGAITVQPVTVGLVTASLAEIKSGINVGDTVVTGTTSSLNSTSSNSNTFNLNGGGAFPGGGTFRGGTGTQRFVVGQ
jgi:RND family efflux transporter MFP subunit